MLKGLSWVCLVYVVGIFGLAVLAIVTVIIINLLPICIMSFFVVLIYLYLGLFIDYNNISTLIALIVEVVKIWGAL